MSDRGTLVNFTSGIVPLGYNITQNWNMSNREINMNGQDIYVRAEGDDPRRLINTITAEFTNCKIYNLKSLIVGNGATVRLRNCLIYGGTDENGTNDGTGLLGEDNIGYFNPAIFLIAVHKKGKLYVDNCTIIPTHNKTNSRGQNGIAVFGECYINRSTVKGGTGGTVDGITLTEDTMNSVGGLSESNAELTSQITTFL